MLWSFSFDIFGYLLYLTIMKLLIKFLSYLIPDKSDFFLMVGIGSIFFGIFQINQPIAYIVTGVLLALVGALQLIPKQSGP